MYSETVTVVEAPTVLTSIAPLSFILSVEVLAGEKNQFLAVDSEIVKKMDYEAQDILDWKASVPFCG